MFTYYHKYPTGRLAQGDYSGLNLSWHRNEQGSQQLRWLNLDSVDGTCSTNTKTKCMPLGPIINGWHHLSLTVSGWHDPETALCKLIINGDCRMLLNKTCSSLHILSVLGLSWNYRADATEVCMFGFEVEKGYQSYWGYNLCVLLTNNEKENCLFEQCFVML